ncbi:MAG: hypothetical protein ACRDPC_03780 [Solirubrobacteraceae bacterium]
MRTKLVAGAVVTVSAALLTAPAQADAAYWKGKTAQGRIVTVRTGDDGLVTRVRVFWRSRCRNSTLRGGTAFVRPIDRLEPRAFEDGGTSRARVEGGIRSRDNAFVRGNMGRRDRWRGTFHMRSVLRRDGRVVDRCRVKRIRWSARRVS